jgi:hypothetical protein
MKNKILRRTARLAAAGLMAMVVLVRFPGAFSQTQEKLNACILETAGNGQIITVRGETVQQPHDLAFDIDGCPDLVVITYAGDADSGVGADQLQRNTNLKRFQKYTSATYKSTSKHICIGCMKYGNVKAALMGKLQVATIPPGTTRDSMGFLRDSSGKVVGTSGFGHPSRMFKYQLVIFSVLDVSAQRIPNPITK